MKYWRGFIIAAIIAACSWGLMDFASKHVQLVDMIYPYITRMFLSFLAGWSGDVAMCVWQLVAVVLVAVFLASIVLMIIFRWNIIRWLGWVTAAASFLFFLHTGLYGLNYYSGPMAADIRLDDTDYSISELASAATYYRDQANKLAVQVSRDGNKKPAYPSFQELAIQAEDGFHAMTYEEGNAVFAGSTVPVKELGWHNQFTSMGITGMTMGLTGEAAVNPETPTVILPYVMCREMLHRMSVAKEQDAAFGAYLACTANESPEFQYAGYFMAYRFCYNALASMTTTSAQTAAAKVASGEREELKQDIEDYNRFFLGVDTAVSAGSGALMQSLYLKGEPNAKDFCSLFVGWHIQEIVLPQQLADAPQKFDPTDENQVDLSGIVNAKPKK